MEAAKAELHNNMVEEERKKRNIGDAINGITSYSNSQKRFLRKVIPKQVGL